MIEVTSRDIRGPFRLGDQEAYAEIANAIVSLSNKVRAITQEGLGDEIEVDLHVLRALRFLNNGLYFDTHKADDEFVGRLVNSIKVKVDYDRTSFGSVSIGRKGKVYFELKLIGLEQYPDLFAK